MKDRRKFWLLWNMFVYKGTYSGIVLVPPAGAGEGNKEGSEDTSRSGQGAASPGTPAE
jgi:hypothetical protein